MICLIEFTSGCEASLWPTFYLLSVGFLFPHIRSKAAPVFKILLEKELNNVKNLKCEYLNHYLKNASLYAWNPQKIHTQKGVIVVIIITQALPLKCKEMDRWGYQIALKFKNIAI